MTQRGTMKSLFGATVAVLLACSVLFAPAADARATMPLVADFRLPVAGRFHSPPAAQQFGRQGNCWTAGGVAYLQRYRPGEHVHIGTDIGIPGDDATVSITMTLGTLPALEGPYMQLFQGTPSDGVTPAQVVELRIDANRLMTVGLFQNRRALATLGYAPVDEPFTVTFDMHPVPVGKVRNARQALGGTDGTLAPFIQIVSAWSVTPTQGGGA
jgi:hypothetical protein